jgi:hypothetical protein
MRLGLGTRIRLTLGDGPWQATSVWAVPDASTSVAPMASFKGLKARIRGDHLAALTAEVDGLREVVLNINHVVVQVQETVNQLNHDVHAGAEQSLPLFLGYSERLRLDADAAIGATQVIERQLALLDERLAATSGSDAP